MDFTEQPEWYNQNAEQETKHSKCPRNRPPQTTVGTKVTTTILTSREGINFGSF